MRFRVFVTTAVTAVLAAGVLVATPTAASAADYVVERISCRSNQQHYTDSDLTYMKDGPYWMKKASWHTHANFKPDRITWSADYGDGVWFLLGAVGASSDTLNDVPVSGSTMDIVNLAAVPHRYRMTVFDRAMGGCSVIHRVP